MQWISVEDRLPPLGTEALATRPIIGDEWHTTTALFTDDPVFGDGNFWMFGDYVQESVFFTHWMPLPEPPTEQS